MPGENSQCIETDALPITIALQIYSTSSSVADIDIEWNTSSFTFTFTHSVPEHGISGKAIK